MLRIFIHPPNRPSVTKYLTEPFTLEDFIQVISEVLGGASREDTISWRLAVVNKPLVLDKPEAFNQYKHFITNECNIFMMVRLNGGTNFQDALHTIAKQQLDEELGKVQTSPKDCIICFDTDDCIKVCCAWMCKDAFKTWFLSKDFKASCTICNKPLVLKDIFKTPEYVATLKALDEETQLLKHIDCQRCLDCGILLYNEDMLSLQTCKCKRVFCFFCGRSWNPATMQNNQHTCSKACVYETKLTFETIPFHYTADMKIPNQRTCPKCFNLGLYDNKCKYHTCTSCKYTFCFLCLEEKAECMRKHRSAYSANCVPAPVVQTYDMFPRLSSS
ncbi:MAG: hypothetical protein J3Q66DRAFT_333984 [Benniella sp.]|nr:MAG: hypothetical protein J3Q66DRAFT_333984 [Benniella sp.]